jgi:hypothetical protein
MSGMAPTPPPVNAGYGYSAGPPPGLPSPDDKYAPGATHHRAKKALILGLLGIFPLSILAGVPAVYVGVRALREIKASEGDLGGRPAAWCGIVLGSLSVAVFVGYVFLRND